MYYEKTKRGLKQWALEEIIATLDARARFDGRLEEVFLTTKHRRAFSLQLIGDDFTKAQEIQRSRFTIHPAQAGCCPRRGSSNKMFDKVALFKPA